MDVLNVNNYLDTLKVNHPLDSSLRDCLRFNAVTNRSIILFKASSVLDRFRVRINNFYIEYYNITFSNNTFLSMLVITL
jgi:hypothetical protein